MKIEKCLKGLMVVDDNVSAWEQVDNGIKSELYEINGNVAVVRITGVLTANQSVLGWTVSMHELLQVVRSLEENNSVEKIIYRIDSPGGVAMVIDILAQEVAASTKETVTVVDGMCASGAYWFASQTDKIIVTPLSQVGSIGAVVYYFHPSEEYGKMVKYTSKNAPVKAATGENKAEVKEIQNRLDATEKEFIAAVARGRKVDESEVIANYGKGGMFLGRDAIEHGLADEIAETFDEIEKEITMSKTTPNVPKVEEATPKVEEATPKVEEATPKVEEATPKVEELAVQIKELNANNIRIAEIMKIEAPGNEAVILAAINNPTSTATSVMQDIIKNPGLMEPLPSGDTNEKKAAGAEVVWEKNGKDKDGVKVQDCFSTMESFLAYDKISSGEFK